jgi:hypothetical protein
MMNRVFTIIAVISLISLKDTQAQEDRKLSEKEILNFFSNVPHCQNGLVNSSGKLYALLVGVDRPNLDFDSLKGPSREIKNLAEVLEKQLYGVKMLVNASATSSYRELAQKRSSGANRRSCAFLLLRTCRYVEVVMEQLDAEL